jgi:hypothetical protein
MSPQRRKLLLILWPAALAFTAAVVFWPASITSDTDSPFRPRPTPQPEPPTPPGPQPLGRTSPAGAVRHVIVVSVDGLRGDLLELMLKYDNPQDPRLPHFRRLVGEGAATFNARSDAFNTQTIPNHVGMITGRPMNNPPHLGPGIGHGFMLNDVVADRVNLHGAAGFYLSSVYDVVHDHGLSTALYASKPKFNVIDRSYDADRGDPDLLPPDDGRDKIDRFVNAASGGRAAPLVDRFVRDLTHHRFHFSLLHVCDPDAAGHATAWNTVEWRRAVADADGYLGQLLDAIASDDALRGRTAIIVTADHGGVAGNHFNIKLPENHTIPFIVWAPRTPGTGGDLYDLNRDTRRDPAREIPGYADALPPIRNSDSANLALSLLGLPPVPGSLVNAQQDLVVGEQSRR